MQIRRLGWVAGIAVSLLASTGCQDGGPTQIRITARRDGRDASVGTITITPYGGPGAPGMAAPLGGPPAGSVAAPGPDAGAAPPASDPGPRAASPPPEAPHLPPLPPGATPGPAAAPPAGGTGSGLTFTPDGQPVFAGPTTPPRPRDLFAPAEGRRDPAPPSPRASLPPPEAGEAAAEEIFRRYRVPVFGDAATPENLRVLEQGLALYRPEHLRGLRSVHIQSVDAAAGREGVWTGEPNNGGSIVFYAMTQRQKPVLVHTVAHELGHHMTVGADLEFGEAFHAALGDAPPAFPSQYAARSAGEKVAENLAFSLLGARSEMRPLAGWSPPAGARALLGREFGGRAAR